MQFLDQIMMTVALFPLDFKLLIKWMHEIMN